MNIGQRVRARRRELEMTQQELAYRARMSLNALSELERGVSHDPHYSTLYHLARALDTTVAKLIGETSQPPAPEGSTQQRLQQRQDNAVRMAVASTAQGAESIYRGYRTGWRNYLNNLSEDWEERIEAGELDRGSVAEFFSNGVRLSRALADILETATREEVERYRSLPVEMWPKDLDETAIAPAVFRFLNVSDRLAAAANEKFADSELEQARRRREEQRAAMHANLQK